MEERKLLQISLIVSLLGIILLFLTENYNPATVEKNITVDFCSYKDENTYIFYSEELEGKAVFEGEFLCEPNQEITMLGNDNGDWFQVEKIIIR